MMDRHCIRAANWIDAVGDDAQQGTAGDATQLSESKFARSTSMYDLRMIALVDSIIGYLELAWSIATMQSTELWARTGVSAAGTLPRHPDLCMFGRQWHQKLVASGYRACILA